MGSRAALRFERRYRSRALGSRRRWRVRFGLARNRLMRESRSLRGGCCAERLRMAATPDAPRFIAARPSDVVVVPATDDRSYAGVITRLLAGAVDAAIIDLVALGVAAVVALALSIFPVGHDTKALLAICGGVVFAIWVIGYFVAFWTSTGETPGDRVMRIRVVRVDGRDLGPLRALARFIAAVIGLVLLLGYIPILFTANRRAFHDWVADTVVITSPDIPLRGLDP